MQTYLIIITLLNQILLLNLPIKQFFMNSIFNNKFMENLIKWTAIPAYAIAFITNIVAIYFFAISIINTQNEKPMKAQTKTKVGLILYLISATALAVAMVLIVIFK